MDTKNLPRALRLSPVLALALVSAVAGATLASAPVGFHGTPLARGTFAGPINLDAGAVEFETEGSVDFATSTVTFDAPGSSGWHIHPGIVLVTVLSGSLTQYDPACAATVHDAGTSFVESGDQPQLVRNESTTTPAVVYVTYVVPTDTPATGLRIDSTNPGCAQE